MSEKISLDSSVSLFIKLLLFSLLYKYFPLQ